MSGRGLMRCLLILTVAALLTAAQRPHFVSTASSGSPSAAASSGIHQIQHVIVIMQENRSFDSYFGTFPGADGLQVAPDGGFVACVPDPSGGPCVRPFHDSADLNAGGPHAVGNAIADIDGGRMDGFLGQAELAKKHCANLTDPACAGSPTEVMGYHDAREIPDYWAFASQFVLQDHMFESSPSWSLPSHLLMVSGWSATCATPPDPTSCRTDLDTQVLPSSSNPVPYSWTDLTYLLHAHSVSWGYYLDQGFEPDCEDDAAVYCAPQAQDVSVPGIWNPLPGFSDVRSDHEIANVRDVADFRKAARNGSLPAVSWIVPSGHHSEHPPAPVSAGQAYVADLVNSVMTGPEWSSSAIFLAWDDWGGLYDHVVPPTVDGTQYGLRVPGIVISPYAKRGFIDHQVLSFDAYLRFIEDDFLGGQRLDPATDGRPDPRPVVRETLPTLGDLTADFDFAGASPPVPRMIPFDQVAAAVAGASTVGLLVLIVATQRRRKGKSFPKR